MTSASPLSLPLDIVIPVYNEGNNILQTLQSLAHSVRTPHRILICYDRDDDTTLTAVRNSGDVLSGLRIEYIRNQRQGAHGAVLAGFAASRAPFVVVMMADDDYNADTIDAMVAKAQDGCDVVCPTRFMPGGSMVGCPWLKAALVRAGNFTLYHLGGLPTRDATNGFRLFTRRVLDQIVIESDRGFCYSIELVVKCHRLNWCIGEVAAQWRERTHGTSRTQPLKWLPAYLRWYFYAHATTYLRRSPASVRVKSSTTI